MAYDHTSYEVQMIPAGNIPSGALATTLDVADLGATGIAARWAPGMVPHVILGAAIKALNGAALTNPVHVGFMADIGAAGTATEMFKIVLPTAGQVNKSVYKLATRRIQVDPGMQVYARVTAAQAGLRAHVVLYVTPKWEELGNVTGALSTT